MNLPSISIVTPTYNQGEYIEETILSVLEQKYPNLEYVIIDGGSTDKTIEIIKKYEKHLKFWVSEKDNGQANAINKGLEHCNGYIFNWLNSDDFLEKNALYHIADGFASGADMLAGNVHLFDSSKIIEIVYHKKLSAKGLMYWEEGVKFVQPGVWMRKDLFCNCGGIDETLHYSFDWDLYIRYLRMYPNVKYLNKTIINFRYHDNSKTVRMQEKFQAEEWEVINKFTKQNHDKYLKKIANYKLAGKDWIPFLKKTLDDTSINNLKKIISILSNVKTKNIILYRATLGALKKIIRRQRFA